MQLDLIVLDTAPQPLDKQALKAGTWFRRDRFTVSAPFVDKDRTVHPLKLVSKSRGQLCGQVCS
jgi:hypothetical protein